MGARGLLNPLDLALQLGKRRPIARGRGQALGEAEQPRQFRLGRL